MESCGSASQVVQRGLCSYDGVLVDELVVVINAVVNRTPAEELRAASNFVAEQYDAEPLEEGEELGGPYADIFIDVV